MTRTDLCSVTDKDRNKTIEAGVMILRLLKFILVTVGKWNSLLMEIIFVSNILHDMNERNGTQQTCKDKGIF